MKTIKDIHVKTNCKNCPEKCCTQPYDWVYLTHSEIERLASATDRSASDFVVVHKNPTTGFRFKVLNLPCLFLDKQTGLCTAHTVRPLICKMFPLYPDPISGQVCLLPGQCGDNLHVSPIAIAESWTVDDHMIELRTWLNDLWAEAALDPSQ